MAQTSAISSHAISVQSISGSRGSVKVQIYKSAAGTYGTITKVSIVVAALLFAHLGWPVAMLVSILQV